MMRSSVLWGVPLNDDDDDVKSGLPCLPACKNCNEELCYNHRIEPDPADPANIDTEEKVEDLVPNECVMLDVPWIDEEVIESDVSQSTYTLLEQTVDDILEYHGLMK